MISLNELLSGHKLEDQSQDVQLNLAILLERINKIRTAYNKPMTVTSGLRTRDDQIRIYRKNALRNNVPFDESKVPMGSQHLTGGAVDIFDPNKKLQKWCLENEKILEEAGLWMEDFSKTPNWCHFQLVAPRSGNRWFIP